MTRRHRTSWTGKRGLKELIEFVVGFPAEEHVIPVAWGRGARKDSLVHDTCHRSELDILGPSYYVGKAGGLQIAIVAIFL